MPIMHKPVIKGKYKVTGKTRVVLIVMENEEYEMHWVCNTSIYMDAGETETLKESITRSNGYLWKMSAIYEVKNFLSRKAWIMIKRNILKAKGRNPVPVKWVLNSKEETDRLIHLKPGNLVKGYMQVPGVDYTESFSPNATNTSTSIMIGLTLYHEEEGWVSQLCELEAELLHPNIPIDMFIE